MQFDYQLFPSRDSLPIRDEERGGLEIYALNVQNPGKDRATALAKYISSLGADVSVLTELTDKAACRDLLSHLHAGGMTISLGDGRDYITAIVSRRPFTPLKVDTPELKGRLAIVKLETCKAAPLYVAGVYGVTCGPQTISRRPTFQRLLIENVAKRLATRDCLLLGDLNVVEKKFHETLDGFLPSDFAHYFAYGSEGYVDVVRRQFPDQAHFTWISPRSGVGQRLDHAFASASLAQYVAEVSIDDIPRKEGLSDHSGIRVRMVFEQPEA